MNTACEKPGMGFVRWVAEDEDRVDAVLEWGRAQGHGGRVADWPEAALRACRDHLRSLARPPALETVSTPAPSAVAPADFGIRTGKDLFFHLKRESQKHGLALLDHVRDWGADRGLDRDMFRWGLPEVAAALEESLARVGSFQASRLETVSTPDPEPAPVPEPTATSPEAQADLEWHRQNLKEHVLEIVAARYPGRKVTAPLLAEALALLTQLDPQSRRLSNVTLCDDRDLLADFLALSAAQLVRLRSTQTPSLLPASGPPPALPPEQLAMFGPPPGEGVEP